RPAGEGVLAGEAEPLEEVRGLRRIGLGAVERGVERRDRRAGDGGEADVALRHALGRSLPRGEPLAQRFDLALLLGEARLQLFGRNGGFEGAHLPLLPGFWTPSACTIRAATE